jgi:ribonuclease HI
MENEIIIHTDGGARGNPGPAAIGFVVSLKNKILYKSGKTIGSTTNNVAEYTAVVEAIKWLIENNSLIDRSANITFYLDSQLVVNQLNGLFKVRDVKLKTLIIGIKSLENNLNNKTTYKLIRREQNSEADLLVNKALDNVK